MFYVPVRQRHKLDPKWRLGSFIGRSWNSDKNRIALGDGTVTRARAMVRVVEKLRWSMRRLENLTMTPEMHTTATLDTIEDEEKPHQHLEHDKHGDEETEPDVPVNPTALRRLKLYHSDCTRHGYTDHFNKCNLDQLGDISRANVAHHTEQCRQRLYRCLRHEGQKVFDIPRRPPRWP